MKFTIHGNHKDPKGNPFPKLKMTGKQHWTPKAQNYVHWKTHVQTAYIEALPTVQEKRKAALNVSTLGKPIAFQGNAEMKLMIYWANEQHGDPENISL